MVDEVEVELLAMSVAAELLVMAVAAEVLAGAAKEGLPLRQKKSNSGQASSAS